MSNCLHSLRKGDIDKGGKFRKGWTKVLSKLCHVNRTSKSVNPTGQMQACEADYCITTKLKYYIKYSGIVQLF